ncbi:hypothetical protein PAHAL_6G207000 [Panicum hallii]|jgi:hypothetical protein|uniref:Uncharacterized protein n=1 Tax=Panicum hallii TaxID=206008 RepID=A0A2S3I2T8_9POAL|nr:hypothetical protein PAHAL_6G207000 [Panicum hallii]
MTSFPSAPLVSAVKNPSHQTNKIDHPNLPYFKFSFMPSVICSSFQKLAVELKEYSVLLHYSSFLTKRNIMSPIFSYEHLGSGDSFKHFTFLELA